MPMANDNDGVLMELDLGTPPSDVLEYARLELGEDPNTRPQMINDFRDMIFDKEECNPHRTDDAFLLRFLRARYFHLERSHRLLCRYYSFKENNAHLHRDVRPEELTFMGEDDVISVPPYREQTGRRLLIYRVGNWNPSKYTVEDMFKATVVVLELGILEERAQILGGVAIFDLEGLALQHAWNVTPTLASKMIEFVVASFPMKIHAIHIVNQSWVFDMVYAIFKPFLDDRMREKLFFHGNDIEALHSHIDPKYLPERYGGTRPDYNYNDWLVSLRRNHFIREEISSLGYILSEFEEDPEDTERNHDKNII